MSFNLKPAKRYFGFSALDLNDFPKSLRKEVVDNYCGDDAAVQAYNLFELVKSRAHKDLIPHPCFVDESSDFDESGVYYGYIISATLTRNRKWIKVKLLLEFDTVRIVFLPANMDHPKYQQILYSLGCSIHSYTRQIVKLTVRVYIDRKGDEKTYIDKVEPVTAQEKQIIYCAAEKLCCLAEQ